MTNVTIKDVITPATLNKIQELRFESISDLYVNFDILLKILTKENIEFMHSNGISLHYKDGAYCYNIKI